MTPTKKKTQQNRRKNNIVVERELQYRFSFKLCRILAVFVFLFTGILIYFVNLNYEMLIQDALIQMPEIVAKLKRELSYLTTMTVASLFVLLFTLFFSSLYLTSKIAGPLYSLKLRLKEFGSGQLSSVRLKFRKNDELHNLAEVFNQSMIAHEKRRNQAKDLIQEMLKRKDTQKGPLKKLILELNDLL